MRASTPPSPTMSLGVESRKSQTSLDGPSSAHSYNPAELFDSNPASPNLSPLHQSMQNPLVAPFFSSDASQSPPSVYEDDNRPVVFVEAPSARLFCQLCNRVFRDPVIASCGHSFCRGCIAGEATCPVDGARLTAVVANIALNEQVGELRVYCRHGCMKHASNESLWERDPDGCPTTLSLTEREEHEASCGYEQVRCPNNPACPVVRQSNLAEHLASCLHVRCPHFSYSCPFIGSAAELTEHLANDCRMHPISEYLDNNARTIQLLKSSQRERDSEISNLQTRVSRISERVSDLDRHWEHKLTALDESQSSFADQLADLRRSLALISDEVGNINARLNAAGGVYGEGVLQPFKCKGTFVGHSGAVWCLAVHGDWLVSGAADKTIKIWDTCTNFKCIKTMDGHTGIVLALSVQGNRLFSGSTDCTVMVWDLDSLNSIKTIPAHDNPVCTLASGRGMLFSGSLKIIKVWDLHTLKFKREIMATLHWVRALTTTEDCLYCGSYQMIKVYTLERLECIRILQSQGGSIYSIAVTAKHIVGGTRENCIAVWDASTFEWVDTLRGHVGTVYALDVLQGPGHATRLLSASYDRTIRVWSLERMLCTQTLLRHQGSVTCLVVSRGSIFSGAVDSTVKVWQ